MTEDACLLLERRASHTPSDVAAMWQVSNTTILPVVLQASLEKKLRAANLQKRNADRANELSAVMRQVPPT